MLCAATGYDAVSLQPNAGSQGEYAGLLMIAAWHASRGEPQRNVCLIPASAHGTNPASAQMAGMQVVVVACDADGNVDLADLEAKARRACARSRGGHGHLSVDARRVRVRHQRICEIVHAHGGQVYVDGANLNALVGLAAPGHFGADVSHLNLHKTFCIPHGGGGPGVGPVAVKAHLAPFLPGHRDLAAATDRAPRRRSARSSRGALRQRVDPADLVDVRDDDGRRRTEGGERERDPRGELHRQALAPHYPVLYAGPGGLVAHECILDLRPLKATSGIEAEDVAKRLMDYGFHAPTMSFPVPGTLMVEPTESEPQAELDRFIDAMIAIRAEIRAIEEGRMDRADNPLKHAPHTAAAVVRGRLDARLFALVRGVSARRRRRRQVLAAGGARRQRLRRSQSLLQLHSGGRRRRRGNRARRGLMRVLVLGAGVVGVTAAWYLAQDGHEVTVLDRHPGAALETSFANGGQISASYAEPWANPEAPLEDPEMAGQDDAPLLFRLRADPQQWRWGLQFLLRMPAVAHAAQHDPVPQSRTVFARLPEGTAHADGHRVRPSRTRHPFLLHRPEGIRAGRRVRRTDAHVRLRPRREDGRRMRRDRARARIVPRQARGRHLHRLGRVGRCPALHAGTRADGRGARREIPLGHGDRIARRGRRCSDGRALHQRRSPQGSALRRRLCAGAGQLQPVPAEAARRALPHLSGEGLFGDDRHRRASRRADGVADRPRVEDRVHAAWATGCAWREPPSCPATTRT